MRTILEEEEGFGGEASHSDGYHCSDSEDESCGHVSSSDCLSSDNEGEPDSGCEPDSEGEPDGERVLDFFSDDECDSDPGLGVAVSSPHRFNRVFSLHIV